MAAQDWLLVGIMIAIVGATVSIGTAVRGYGSGRGLIFVVAFAVGLGGYAMARLKPSPSQD